MFLIGFWLDLLKVLDMQLICNVGQIILKFPYTLSIKMFFFSVALNS